MEYWKISPLPKKDIQLDRIYLTGTLSEDEFVNYTGDVLIRYNDGQMLACHLKEGVLNGPSAEFDAKGERTKSGYYKDGLPDGRWEFKKPLSEEDVARCFGSQKQEVDQAWVVVTTDFKKGKVVSGANMTMYVSRGTSLCEACQKIEWASHLQCPSVLPRKLTSKRIVQLSKTNGGHGRVDKRNKRFLKRATQVVALFYLLH